MENEPKKSNKGIVPELLIFNSPPHSGESIKRIMDIEDIRKKYNQAIKGRAKIDKKEEDPSQTSSMLEIIEQAIDDYAAAIKEKIVWGVYGNTGELVDIVTKQYSVERLEARDAKALQVLYTEGLAKEPAFFGSTLEIERAKTIEEVKKYIKNNYVVGIKQPYMDKNGKQKERLVAMASVRREKDEQAHIAHAGMLYVDPDQRIRGLSERILEHIIRSVVEGRQEGLEGIEQLKCVVTATNKFAITYYEKLGWVQYHHQANAAKRGDKYYDWIYMMMDITAIRRKMGEEKRKTIMANAPMAIKNRKGQKSHNRGKL